jgi:hypothetical protein
MFVCSAASVAMSEKQTKLSNTTDADVADTEEAARELSVDWLLLVRILKT